MVEIKASFMTKTNLDNVLQKRIHEHTKAVYERKKKDEWYIVAACSASLNDSSYELGVNGAAKESDYDPRLVARVKTRFGGKTIGEKTGLVPWEIGRCAEQHAANEVLKKSRTALIDDFQFSDAVYAKCPTMKKESCLNCKSIFDQL